MALRLTAANYQKLSKKDKDRLIDPFVFWDDVKSVPIMIFAFEKFRATYDVGRLNTLKLLMVCPILVYFASN